MDYKELKEGLDKLTPEELEQQVLIGAYVADTTDVSIHEVRCFSTLRWYSGSFRLVGEAFVEPDQYLIIAEEYKDSLGTEEVDAD